MDISLWAVIEVSPKEVHKDMQATLGDGAPSYRIVKKWNA